MSKEDLAIKRKVKLINGEIESFMIKDQSPPCGCGSNLFHKVDDGINIIGVCNSCDRDIYQQAKREEFAEWKYKNKVFV